MATVQSEINIPEGFAEEETDAQLYQEDLEEDSELWLIRVPSDIQLSDLDRKKIYLGANTSDVNIKNIRTEDGRILECCAENCDISNMCIVLPDKNSHKLHAVRKVFKGAILISEGLDLNDETEVKSEIDDSLLATTLEDTPDLSHESKRKKNKKRRPSHNSDLLNLNYETEDADSTIPFVHKHKHSKKHSDVSRKNNECKDVKSEPESVDSDGFPLCTSQN